MDIKEAAGLEVAMQALTNQSPCASRYLPSDWLAYLQKLIIGPFIRLGFSVLAFGGRYHNGSHTILQEKEVILLLSASVPEKHIVITERVVTGL
jgi:hypothetical protein